MKINWIAGHFTFILSVLALPIALVALVFALNNKKEVNYSGLTGEESAVVAQQALEEADRSVEAANTILGLLEVGLGLLSALIAVAAVLLTINVRDIRGDLERQAKHNQEIINERLDQREAKMTEIDQQVRDVATATENKYAHLDQLIRSQLEKARTEAENSFKVLSLQLLAEQQVRARNYRTAIKTLTEAYELDKQNQTTNYLLGYLYTAIREFGDAMKHLDTALVSNPNFAPALAALGLAQRRIGDRQEELLVRNRFWSDAENNLIRALEIDPNMVDADGESYYGSLGGLYRRQSRHEDARRVYEEAVKVTPNSSYPVGNLAVLYKFLGNNEKALETFAKVQNLAENTLEDNPADHWARLDLAQALLVQGETEEALREYQNLVLRQPPSGALETGLSGLEFLQQSPQSIEGIEDAIQILKSEIKE